MTVSAGKAATGVYGITLHYAFHLPVKSQWKLYGYEEPNDETIHILTIKYQHLKLKGFDNEKILVIGRETFGRLYLALKAVMQNLLPFGVFVKTVWAD